MNRPVAKWLMIFLGVLFLAACAGKILQMDKSDDALKVEEFDKKVQIKEADVIEPPKGPEIKDDTEVAAKGAKAGKGKKVAKPVAKPKETPQKGPVKRQPELEDSQGFNGRRPVADPFRVGEKVTFDVSYFNVVAGTINVEVKPFASVNGQKAYHFEISGRSNSFFSRIYAVEDKATTYMSYDDLVPLNLQISIKESKQLAETRTLFDWKTMKASYWQKRVTKEKGERSKQIDWDLLPFSQNVITAPYYLRTFQLEPGKKLAFRVADEGKNIVFTGEVLRREVLKTPIGDLKTVVVRPQITADGAFKPIGDIQIWLTDDDRKFLVRLESKIKIGTVVAKLKSIEKGRE